MIDWVRTREVVTRLPAIGRKVLVYDLNNREYFIAWFNGTFWEQRDGVCVYPEQTCWTGIPDPPEVT